MQIFYRLDECFCVVREWSTAAQGCFSRIAEPAKSFFIVVKTILHEVRIHSQAKQGGILPLELLQRLQCIVVADTRATLR